MIRVEPDHRSGAARDCYWTMGYRPSSATRVSLPPGGRYLWLNPATTTPNVLLGVNLRGVEVYMKPGDLLPLPPHCNSVQVWNPVKRLYVSMSAELVAGQVGQVGLTVLDESEAFAVKANNNPPTSQPLGLLFAASAKAGVVYFPTHNLKGVRIIVRALNPAEDTIVPEPADFAATLYMGTALTIASLSNITSAGTFFDPITTYEQGNDATFALVPARNDQLTTQVAQFQVSWDLPVVAPAALATAQVVGISGTGISANRVALFIEGR